jgi:glycosyltransferase involved in cell wall biosynthesis
MPSISVIIPLFNKGPYIVRAIGSVLAQTVQDFEIIVVNDGSTDNGGEIVASYRDPRIRLIHQENQGVSAARNRGVHESSSDFIAFLDADDGWETDHLEVLLRLKRSFPEAGAYSTAYFYVYPGGKVVPAKLKAIPAAPWEGILSDYFKAAALGDPPITSSTVAIKKSILQELSGFKGFLKRGEDLDLWARLALREKIAFSWQGIGLYIKTDNSSTCNMNTDFYKGYFYEEASIEKSKNTITSKYYYRYISKIKANRIKRMINYNKTKEAFKEILSLKINRFNKIDYLKLWIKLVFNLIRNNFR